MALSKNDRRQRIKNRIRKIVTGTASQPRLAVFRSNKEIYAQLVDDVSGATISAASSRDKEISSTTGSKVDIAALVGKSVAEKALKAGVESITFDRGGYLYHGRVKSLAEGARGAGLKPSGLDLKDRLVGVQRVTKVTKGGRAFGFSAIVVVGDEAGVVGQGLGKSKDVASAIAKAVEDAKKNLVRIPLIKGTLPHEQKGKYGGARVNIIPAAPGTGVIAGGAVRTVLEAVGVHDVLSKSQGSSNPHNVVKATFDALLQLRDAKAIARERGISLTKVFNG